MDTTNKNTKFQYDSILEKAKDIFYKKTTDYGTLSWSILRSSSLTDQIWIKAKRIRTIQQAKEQKVSDSLEEDFIGVVNYSVIALIQTKRDNDSHDISADDAIKMYSESLEQIRNLHHAKNHDYGDAWRDLRISSMTDLILAKLLRIKQIESNNGETIISEGITSGYQDIVNYAIFCLIHISEGKDPITE